MNVGWVGLGKLGLPCAMVLADAGHDVYGYDVSDAPARILAGDVPPPVERGLADLDASRLKVVGSVAEVVSAAAVVFVAVPTPHDREYGGETPMPSTRRDFDYAPLREACTAVATAAVMLRRHVTLVVVSTVLPGTLDREIRPLLHEYVTLVYNPFFIAMGTTVADFRRPEFVLFGVDDAEHLRPVFDVYRPVHSRPAQVMSIPSAELAKVSYNTFISLKITFANMLMEICHGTDADVDAVTGALAQATDRVISPKYLRAGMGDGGACHPRDLIAMSWVAQRLGLSYDLLGEMVTAREAQTRWLANLVGAQADRAGLPIVILGKAYKAGSPLTYGSPALLLDHYLTGRFCTQWDPYAGDLSPAPTDRPAVFVIATDHPEFFNLDFPPGSVVVDPWGRTPARAGVTVIRVGRHA